MDLVWFLSPWSKYRGVLREYKKLSLNRLILFKMVSQSGRGLPVSLFSIIKKVEVVTIAFVKMNKGMCMKRVFLAAFGIIVILLIAGGWFAFVNATDETYEGMSIIPEEHEDIPIFEGLKQQEPIM